MGELQQFPLTRKIKSVKVLDYNKLTAEYERRLIDWALKASGGNITRAAEHLNLKRTTLAEAMKRHKLKKETYRKLKMISPQNNK